MVPVKTKDPISIKAFFIFKNFQISVIRARPQLRISILIIFIKFNIKMIKIDIRR